LPQKGYNFSQFSIMTKAAAVLIAIFLLLLGNPIVSFSQQQDTIKSEPALMPMGSPQKEAIKPQVAVTPAIEKTAKKEQPTPKKHNNKKEKKSLMHRLRMIGHKKRERAKWHNEGHHELYTKSPREQKRITRHHLSPNKIVKTDKKMMARAMNAGKKDNKKSKGESAGSKEEVATSIDEAKPQDKGKTKEEGVPKEEAKQKEDEKPKQETPKEEPKPKEETEKPKGDGK
jgi:hypothetical protein